VTHRTAGHAVQRLGPTNVEDLLGELSSRDGALELDLARVGALERSAGALLSNALLGSIGERPLNLRVENAQLDWLAASGLAFAVANRPGPTTVENRSNGRVLASSWLTSWRPGHKSPTVRVDDPTRLFGPTMLGETALQPDLYGPGFAAFVNPHLYGVSGGHHPLTTLLWPWLDRLLPQRSGGITDRDTRTAWIADCGRLIDELVLNVCDHAAGDASRSLYSLVQISVTRGGGGRSSNRLHICVQDTGVGVPTSARPKIDPAKRSSLDEAQLVGCLLDGSLAPWGRARGQGLPRVVDIARRRKGTLRLATMMTKATLETGPGCKAAGAIRVSRSSFCLKGTVLTLTLPIKAL
jgi:hypothetical protein